MTWIAAAVAALALAAVGAAAVLSIRDDRRVRRTDEIVERWRADKALADDEAAEIGDDIVAMVKAWQDEVQR